MEKRTAAVPATLVGAPAAAGPARLPAIFTKSLAAKLGAGAAIAQALEHRRLLILVPFALILGLVVYVAVPEEPQVVLLGAGLALGAAALIVLRHQARALPLAILLVAGWAGFCLMPLHGALWGTEMLRRPLYGTYRFEIDQVLSVSDGKTRAIVSDMTPIGTARSAPMRRARIILSADDLAPGDQVQSAVRFYPVPGPVVPNGFDAQFQGYFDGIGAYGNTTGDLQRLQTTSPDTPARLIERLRRGIAARIDAQLRQPAAGIARALITGDQSAIADSTRDIMAAAGLAHVLAVSGLHLSLVAGLALLGLRYGLALFPAVTARLPVKRIAAAGAIVLCLGYFAISGGNVSALRSTIMLLLVLTAVIIGRRALTMRNVAFAALAVILFDPASVFRPSFQLSFAAVIALIAAWEIRPRSELAEPGHAATVLRYLAGIIATSLIAGTATLLFSIYHFQQTAPLGALGNLVALPLVTLVTMPSALIATLLMPFGLEAFPLQLMGWSIERMLDVATLTAALSEGLRASPLLTPLALGLGLAAFAWFAFIETKLRLLAPVLLVPAVMLFALDRAPDVLVSDTTQAVAIRGSDGLELVSGTPQSFAVRVWRETYAEPLAKAPDGTAACDSLGCSGTSSLGFRWTLAKDAAALFEDCGDADLIVIRRPIQSGCNGTLVLDANTLERQGVEALYWREDSFEVRSAITGQGRPWRLAFPGS